MKQFWLIRHGQSTSNIGERIAYRGAPPLTALGRAQAEHVAAILPATPDLIVTSTFVRAQQTAVPLCGRFPHVPVQEWPVQEVTSLPIDEYPGTNGEERWPRIKSFWEQGDPHFSHGGGAESFADTNTRAAHLLTQLENCPAAQTVVFTHGLFMRFVLWVWLHGSVEKANDKMVEFQPFRRSTYIPNTAIIRGIVTADQLYLSNIQIDHITATMP